MIHIHTSLHVHIYTGIYRYFSRMLLIFSISVRYHFIDRGIVCNYKSIKIPFITENVLQQVFIPGGRYSVQIIKRCHYRTTSGIERSLEWRKICIPQFIERHIHRIVISPCHSRPISSIMLHTGNYSIYSR